MTSTSPCHAVTLKFGFLTPSQCACDKTQVQYAVWWADSVDIEWRQGSEGCLGHLKGDCSLLSEELLESAGCELLSQGMKKRAGTIFLHSPLTRMDLRLQHNTNNGGLSHLHQALPTSFCWFSFTRASVNEKEQQAPSLQDQQPPRTKHQVY